MAEANAISSGNVIDGTENATGCATKLLDTMWWIRRCAIAIANDTEYNLYHPHRHADAGNIVSMPLKIPPGKTGLIGAYKTAALATGTSGVITYEFEGLQSQKNYLQIMWSVPYMGSNWVNVNLGKDSASADLFRQLYDGSVGRVRKAMDVKDTDMLDIDNQVAAEVHMGSEGLAVLVVHLKSLSRST